MVWIREFLTHRFNLDHPLDPVRLDLTMRLARELGVLEGVDLLEPEPAPDAELEQVHVPSYLEAVRAAPEKATTSRTGSARTTTRSSRGCTRRAVWSAVALLAAREIVEGRADRAVNIASGPHHAMPNRASGFCVYNDCAVAISWLLDHGLDRIAYVDVDVHHGDGVHAALTTTPG